MEYSPFRGKLVNVLPFYKKKASVIIINGELVEGNKALDHIYEITKKGMHSRLNYYNRKKTHELELEYQIIYSYELQSLYQVAGLKPDFLIDIEKAILNNSVAQPLMKAMGLKLYSDVYFRLVTKSLFWAC